MVLCFSCENFDWLNLGNVPWYNLGCNPLSFVKSHRDLDVIVDAKLKFQNVHAAAVQKALGLANN